VGPPLSDAQREYRRFLRSATWRATRARILARDPMCTSCGRRRSRQVHHKVYGRIGYLVPDEMLPLPHSVKDIEKGTFCTFDGYVDVGRRTRAELLESLDQWRMADAFSRK
jgi:hypothetical protein